MVSVEGNRQSFDDLVYQRPDIDRIENQMRRARLRLRLALNPESAVAAVHEMQTIQRHYLTQSTLARIRHDRQSDDVFYAGEMAFLDQADTRFHNQLQQFYSALLAARHKPVLEKRFGTLLLRKAESFRMAVRPEILSDLAEENRLATRYKDLISSLSVTWQDDRLSLPKLEAVLQDPDRLVRKQAHAALADAYAAKAHDLDVIYDQMVRCRHQMAGKLGFRHFTDLAWQRLERYDYTVSQVEALRQTVVRTFVPMAREIRRLQRKRLKLDHLAWYDLPCLNPEGNPRLAVTPGQYCSLADQPLSILTGERPSFLSRMNQAGYLDLEARPHKSPGAYCETLHDAQSPFILMNAAGTARDVPVLFHEAGHAYASLASLSRDSLLEYHQPTLDVCEIHATALEYLTLNSLQPFFETPADDFVLMHLAEAVLFMPYGCLIDHFQQEVYQQPNMTPLQRNQLWLKLEALYQPDLDYEEAPFFTDGRAWQKKEHVYLAPFYYIDYVLAQIVALDLWRTSQKRPERAWEQYRQLCSLGGGDTLLGLLGRCGLPSPFAADTIKRVAYAVCDCLSL